VPLQAILESAHGVLDIRHRENQVAFEHQSRSQLSVQLVCQLVIALQPDAEGFALVEIANHLAGLPTGAVPDALDCLQPALLDVGVVDSCAPEWAVADADAVVIEAHAGEGAVDVQRRGKGDREKAVEQEDGGVGDPLLDEDVVAAEPDGDKEHHHQHGSEFFEILTGVQDVVPARARASIFRDRGTRHARNCSGDGSFSLNSILRRQQLD
jgi:hypothetical protein